MNWNKIKAFISENNSQSHLCICNTDLFEDTLVNGIYGFPHAGTSRQKSFWRSIASMYNIGKNDLIFIYRTNGEPLGCKEIHGPFKIYDISGQPSTFYDLNSTDFPMEIKGETDCKVRFLFTKFENEVFSIADNYELIKKYESREIWGYRHPAVMNIGAARKKSVAAFTNKQTLTFIEMLERYGVQREILDLNIPSKERIDFIENLENSDYKFMIDSIFLAENYSNDEAYLYSYFISALKNSNNYYSADLVNDFTEINAPLLRDYGLSFTDLSKNIMLEVIITTHLQDELDVVISDKNDKNIIFFEFKVGKLTQKDIRQTEKYIDLLNAINPERKYFANLIGSGKETGLTINTRFLNQMRLVEYEIIQRNPIAIRFNDITI